MTPEEIRNEYEMEEMLYGRYESIADDIEYEDCILCCEAHDIEDCKMVNGAWVCMPCVQDNRAEGRSTYHMVLDAQRRIAERRARINEGVKDLKNFMPLVKSITESYKPKLIKSKKLQAI